MQIFLESDDIYLKNLVVALNENMPMDLIIIIIITIVCADISGV